jgi:hypothetical protein
MHTTITCIRLYPRIGQFPRLPESHLLWRRRALGPLVCFNFFFSSDWFGILRIAYCEGFAGFSGMASDAWAWVMVGLGLFCVFGDWRGMPCGLGVNGHLPSLVVLFDSRVELCMSFVQDHQPRYLLVETVAQEYVIAPCTSYPL